MTLHAVTCSAGKPNKPWIVWLHGFLGSHQEWLEISPHFSGWPQLLVDLPGHGGSAGVAAKDFADVDNRLRATLNSYNILNYWLVGYSLGGRMAMYHACQPESHGLRGLVVEGSHPGLQSENEREARALGDARWAARLRDEDLPDVLNDWYRQPVFRSLNAQQRKHLVALRSQNDSRSLAQILEAISLARQPDLREPLSQLAAPFHYLCGERDEKFRAVSKELACPVTLIPGVGHNAHRDAPAAFSSALLTLFRHYDQ